MSEEWGPWVEHDGFPVPSLQGVLMNVVAFNGRDEIGIMNAATPPPVDQYSCFCWALTPWVDNPSRIIRYRIPPRH